VPAEGERVPDERAVPSLDARAGHDNRLQEAVRRTVCVAVLGIAALTLPGVAAAHGRAATVALDYKLSLDPDLTRLAGVRASILDGDRSLHLVALGDQRVLVLGDLGEPMLRLEDGVWVNQSSPTAQANRLVRRPAPGWKRVAGGRTFSWHEHRLAPPPFAAGSYGRVARFSIPLLVDGRRVAISGSFVRVPRPAAWPWAAGAVGAIGLAAVVIWRRPELRRAVTIAAGGLAGAAGLTAQTAFSLRDAPSGRIAWALVVAGFAIAAIAAGSLVLTRGSRRAYLAGMIGVCVAVFCLSWLGVFFHGAVISALPGASARLVCAVAFTAGLISLIGVLGIDADEEAVRT
jgi:hypothetical protein